MSPLTMRPTDVHSVEYTAQEHADHQAELEIVPKYGFGACSVCSGAQQSRRNAIEGVFTTLAATTGDKLPHVRVP